ncbi:hypothetical protein NSTCB13_01038 [Nostoc sp. DSM 114160]|jgi:hypothetical protein
MANSTDPRGCAGTWYLDDGWSGSPSSDGMDVVGGFELDDPTWVQLGGGTGGGSAELRATGTDNRVLLSTPGLSAYPPARIYTKSKSFTKTDPSCTSNTSYQEKYDCINGQCKISTTYNTPGLYQSLADCQAACANGGACASGKQCVDPTTFIPSGKVCIDQGEFDSIEALISKIGSEVC